MYIFVIFLDFRLCTNLQAQRLSENFTEARRGRLSYDDFTIAWQITHNSYVNHSTNGRQSSNENHEMSLR